MISNRNRARYKGWLKGIGVHKVDVLKVRNNYVYFEYKYIGGKVEATMHNF